MASAWEKIQALQAKLAAAQKNTSKQKLSERNMIEIVETLKSMGLVDLITTTDARSYVTPEQLKKEIIENVNEIGHGRLNLADLSEILTIDFTTIEKYAAILLEEDSTLKIINGQLITRNYFDNLALEVADNLNYSGRLSLAEITLTYDLSSEIITNEIFSRLKTKGFNVQGNNITTELYSIVEANI